MHVEFRPEMFTWLHFFQAVMEGRKEVGGGRISDNEEEKKVSPTKRLDMLRLGQ